MMVRSLRWIALVLAAWTSVVRASSDSGWVRVVTVPDGSPVFIDGRYVGDGPVDAVRWPAGRAVVQTQRGSRHQWNPAVAAETVLVAPERSIEVRLTAPEPVLVTSDAFSAHLRDAHGHERSLPFWWTRDRLPELTAGAPYEDPPGPVVLVRSPVPDETPVVMRGPGTLGVRSETWTVASGAAIVVSGVLAALFRDKANHAAERYLQTGDPAALDDVRRYDRIAGAAMVSVQVSLGAFVLFLAGP